MNRLRVQDDHGKPKFRKFTDSTWARRVEESHDDTVIDHDRTTVSAVSYCSTELRVLVRESETFMRSGTRQGTWEMQQLLFTLVKDSAKDSTARGIYIYIQSSFEHIDDWRPRQETRLTHGVGPMILQCPRYCNLIKATKRPTMGKQDPGQCC